MLAPGGPGALLTVGVQSRDPWVLGSYTAFGTTMVLLHTMSTLYHSFHPPGLKKLFQLFDHVSIYLLIAGTYTPYMLVSLRHGSGVAVLLFVWGLAVIGILSEVFLVRARDQGGAVAHLCGHGWAVAYDLDGLRVAIPPRPTTGCSPVALAYTCGVVFYVLTRWGACATPTASGTRSSCGQPVPLRFHRSAISASQPIFRKLTQILPKWRWDSWWRKAAASSTRG